MPASGHVPTELPGPPAVPTPAPRGNEWRNWPGGGRLRGRWGKRRARPPSRACLSSSWSACSLTPTTGCGWPAAARSERALRSRSGEPRTARGRGVAATPLAAPPRLRRHRQRRDRPDRDRLRESRPEDPNLPRPPPRQDRRDGGMALPPPLALVPRGRAGGAMCRRREEPGARRGRRADRVA